MKKPLIIAYFLPQFHPIPENDEWWGKGFTEWTNVGKAKPLFKGHNQPRIPTDLGYYDLRIPAVREQQAILARDAGIGGFCYWHYWFSPEQQLLNEIIDDVAYSGKPDFPFCLGWANESWKAKSWSQDGNTDTILIEQTYGGETDYRKHYEYVKKLIKNKNYIRIDDRPFFLVYKPENHPEIGSFINLWNKWIKEDKIAESFYFVASVTYENNYESFLNQGFNAVTMAHYQRVLAEINNKQSLWNVLKERLRIKKHLPIIVSADDVYKHIIKEKDYLETVIPFMIPQWDHTPRSGVNGYLIKEATPEKFYEQAKKVLGVIEQKNNKIIMLKSWNEWAEGNFMEPDLTYGENFLSAIKKALNETTL